MNHCSAKTVWQSYVYHGDRAVFVSTIERDYDTVAGTSRGLETLVWEWDPVERKRGELVHQAGGISDHVRICRCFVAEGLMPDEEDPRTARFYTP